MSVPLRGRYGEPQLIDVGRNDHGRRKGGPINIAPRSVSGPLVAGGGGALEAQITGRMQAANGGPQEQQEQAAGCLRGLSTKPLCRTGAR